MTGQSLQRHVPPRTSTSSSHTRVEEPERRTGEGTETLDRERHDREDCEDAEELRLDERRSCGVYSAFVRSLGVGVFLLLLWRCRGGEEGVRVDGGKGCSYPIMIYVEPVCNDDVVLLRNLNRLNRGRGLSSIL